MQPVKCSKCNLFYDAERFTACPHCAKGGSVPQPTYKKAEKQSKHTQNEEKEPVQSVSVSSAEPEKKGLFGFLKRGKKNKNNEPKDKQSQIPTRDQLKKQHSEKVVSEQKADSKNANDSSAVSDAGKHTGIQQTMPLAKKNEDSGKEQISIAEAVKKAGSAPAAVDQKTVARYNFSNEIEPVVGWLVCIKGEYKGDSFNLKTGRNSIGRSLTMDIALAKEKSVSREKHAFIIFEPNKKQFFLQSGESSGLTYLNDDLVLSAVQLKESDVISVGESKFMFISFVGDLFSWDTYANEDKAE